MRISRPVQGFMREPDFLRGEPRPPRPISLSDHQLQAVALAASSLEPEKRSAFLERVGGHLNRLGRFRDADVDNAIRLALCGLLRR